MACYKPSLAVDYGINPDTGKHRIKFLSRFRADLDLVRLKELHGDNLLMLPCGSCLGCKFDKARDWATRCYLESMYYSRSCFLTLTYDEDHCPLLLPKDDFREFYHDLYNHGIFVKYFACGEYGSKKYRPHWHCILFGYYPPDCNEPYSKGSNGDFIYESALLKSIWKKGQVFVGDCSFRSAGYIARYTTKKLGSDGGYLFMSRNLGMQYLKDHVEKLLFEDKIIGDFGSMSFAALPRAFNKFLKENYPDKYEIIKKARLKKSKLLDLNRLNDLRFGHLEELYEYRASQLNDKLQRIERS